MRESAASWESTRAKSDDHTEPAQALSSASEQAARCESKSSQKTPGKMTRSDTELVALIDEIYMECPFFGQRQLRNELQKLGHRIGRNRIRWLMKLMGIEALCPKPSTSKSSPAHKKYPYLLRNVGVTEVAQVWCTDVTYIPMPQGHCYLVAIMDWHSRAVLAWEVSNSMDTEFCIRALQRAFERTGRKPKNLLATKTGPLQT